MKKKKHWWQKLFTFNWAPEDPTPSGITLPPPSCTRPIWNGEGRRIAPIIYGGGRGGGKNARGLHLDQAQFRAVFAFLNERAFQDNKYGPLHRGGAHTIGEWVLLIEAELAEAKEALIKGGKGRDSVLCEIIQIGALALAAIEQHGTQEITKRSV